MPRYIIHVFCDACSKPHPMGIAVNLSEEIDANQSVADVYDGREVPPNLVTLTANQVRCPATGQMVRQRDNRQVFLVRTE